MSRVDPQMKIRLPEALKLEIESAAQANKRSMNAEIVACLEAFYSSAPILNTQKLRKFAEFASVPAEKTERLIAEIRTFLLNIAKNGKNIEFSSSVECIDLNLLSTINFLGDLPVLSEEEFNNFENDYWRRNTKNKSLDKVHELALFILQKKQEFNNIRYAESKRANAEIRDQEGGDEQD